MTNPSQPAKRRFRLNSILVKIAALLLVSGMVVSAVMAWNNIRTSLDLIRDQISHTALETNKLLAASSAESIQKRATARLQGTFAPLTGALDNRNIYATAVNSDNEVLVEGGAAPEMLDPLKALAARAMSQGASVTAEDGMLVATPVFNAMAGKPVGAVASAWSAADAIAQERRATLLSVLLACGVVGAAIVAVMLAVGRWIAVPIRRLARTLDRLAAADYDLEVETAGRGDELGDIGRAVSHLRDQLEIAREGARENRFRGTAVKASSAAVMMVDADFRIMSVNETALEIMRRHEAGFRVNTPGFDPEKIVGQEMGIFHPGPLKKRVRSLLLDPADAPYRTEMAVGESRFRLTVSRVETEKGDLDGFVVEWDDVSAEFMKQAILSTIASNQIQAEFRVDGTLLSGNALMSKAMGQGVEDLIGNASEHLFDFDKTLAEIKGTVFEQINRGEAVHGQFRLKRSDGGTAVIDGGFAPVRDTKDRLLRIVLIGQDITAAQAQLKRSEEERVGLQEAQGRVVETLRTSLEKLAEGDLTARIETAFTQDYDRLRVDFNEAASRLQTAMRGVIENAELIQGEASEISNAADDLSNRTERQAAALEQTASALDELTASVKSSADGASSADALVDGARKDAEASGDVVREAVGAMGEIESSSQQISKITGVIDDIAFQTNLLALNAGVEAARAGEAGRGFAVVASEVRALAQRSSEAAREINVLISASDGQVRRGVDLVDQAGKALAGIVVSVQKISQNVSEIALSSQEQSAGLAEINTAMNQLDQVTQQNAAMFEETTAASHALTREAQTLTQTMGRFQTDREATAPENVVSPRFSNRRRDPAPSAVAQNATGSAHGHEATVGAGADDDGWDEF